MAASFGRFFPAQKMGSLELGVAKVDFATHSWREMDAIYVVDSKLWHLLDHASIAHYASVLIFFLPFLYIFSPLLYLQVPQPYSITRMASSFFAYLLRPSKKELLLVMDNFYLFLNRTRWTSFF